MLARHTLFRFVALLAFVAAAALPVQAIAAEARSLVVMDFELVDDQNNPQTKAAQVDRLQSATRQLQQALTTNALYRIVDPAPSVALQERLRTQQEFLYRCDDCAAQIGRAAGADLVMATWVQKVSELILNLNVQILDVATERVVFTKSVDMRGNNDESWSRAVRYLVRDMAEKRALNPRYGQ
jgi:Protein of unknown function (DUF2380)